jgi:hypothetical protein
VISLDLTGRSLFNSRKGMTWGHDSKSIFLSSLSLNFMADSGEIPLRPILRSDLQQVIGKNGK